MTVEVCIFAPAMEEWKLEFEWLRVRHIVKDVMQKESLPDMNALLFLIGIQELGFIKEEFTKEEKQDLMHLAICRLLEDEDYFEFEGIDADGWPHYTPKRPFQKSGVEQQEELLKEKIIHYFRHLEKERGAFTES